MGEETNLYPYRLLRIRIQQVGTKITKNDFSRLIQNKIYTMEWSIHLPPNI